MNASKQNLLIVFFFVKQSFYSLGWFLRSHAAGFIVTYGNDSNALANIARRLICQRKKIATVYSAINRRKPDVIRTSLVIGQVPPSKPKHKKKKQPNKQTEKIDIIQTENIRFYLHQIKTCNN